MSNDDWVFWLSAMNIGLGVAVLVPVLVIAVGVVWELVLKHRKAHIFRHLSL
jgi:hypothetical protein